MAEHNKIQPQAGFQSSFLSSPADIVLGGGAAGAGKSYALLMEYPRHSHIKNWNGVIFRRTYAMINAAGGLWDTALGLFTAMGRQVCDGVQPIPVDINSSKMFIEWPSGSRLNFSHLQHEKDKLNWQGSQIGYLGFDELTQFTISQFFYLLSRNRSPSGIKPYCRCTTNPQGQGWVKDMVSWYLYPDDWPNSKLAAFPRVDRVGKLRYFTRYKGQFVWGNTKEEVLEKLPSDVASGYSFDDIKSFTFIPGLLADNKILTSFDPSYKGNLLAQDQELMEQLLLGRWITLRDDADRLFPYTFLIDVFSNSFVGKGKKYITADIALEGSDKFIVIIWEGYRIVAIYEYPTTTGKQVLDHIKEKARMHGVPNSHIVVDADGVGGYLPSFLRGTHAFRNGARPMEVDQQVQNYDSLKSQCFYLLSRLVKDYSIFIDIASEHLIERIIEELYAVKKVITTTSKLSITKKALIKEEIGRSPDLADAIAMRVYFDLLPKGAVTSSAAL